MLLLVLGALVPNSVILPPAPAQEPAGVSRFPADPGGAQIVTSDIDNFWEAFEAAQGSSEPGQVFDELYFGRASPGLRDFVAARRLKDGETLWRTIRANLDYYRGLKASTDRLSQQAASVREAFRRVEEIYPQAVYPPIYFLIGGFLSGGTTSANGLLIGTELYGKRPGSPQGTIPPQIFDAMGSIEDLPVLIVHELAHFQQEQGSGGQPTLLVQTLREGSADLLTELAMGRTANENRRSYGMQNEASLWAEFRPQMGSTDYGPWMYSVPPDGRPKDLAYFIGYRISRAFYDRANDKRAALARLFAADSHDEALAILAESGYSPGLPAG